jgi:hypothetical protein
MPHVAKGAIRLLITTSKNSVKGRAMRSDPRVAACIDDDRPPLNGGDGMMAVRITPEKIVSEDNITDITGIAVGTTRTRADAGEHRPSLQRGQPRPVADRRRVRTSAVPAVPERTLDPEPDLVAEQRSPYPGDAGGHEHEHVS